MAELRRISYQNRVHAKDYAVPGNSGSQRHKGYKKSSYELETVHTSDGNNGFESSHNGDGGVPAVVVRGACKHYKKGVPVLEKLNMTVQRGAIYSLLGSSGCGKTTTLGCIVGVRKLNAGEVFVFGARPGVKGQMVGYMPQETSLYRDFSIAETLSYFGTLCGMDRDAARKGTAFLTKLLQLPESSRRVGSLSGGQRRRVSFAVALIHNPDLLILDEPTVGVDPLLREHIWKHLVSLSTERGTTVLITTHYIDEAKDSTAVGVMRFGRLLVEEDPSILLRRFNTTSLEVVVLKLCRKDTENAGAQNRDMGQLEYVEESQPDSSEFIPPSEDDDQSKKILDSMKRINSIIYKNFSILFRNLLLFFFTAIMPAFIIFVMCIAFKDDPKNLDFGVVNYEVPNFTFCSNLDAHTPGECDIENLSCKFMNHIPKEVVNLISFDTDEQALAAVHKGNIWGYVKFPEEFSTDFYDRSSNGGSVDEEIFNKSEIIVRMDQTSQSIVSRVKKNFHDGFEDFAKTILRDCGFDERQAEFPLHYKTPVFGTEDTKFIDFVAPSITVAWLFFFPIIAASIRSINEKKEGTYERSLVAGTKNWEVLFAYFCAECIVLVLQSLLVYLILIFIIGIELLGSSILVMMLFILSGFGGVSMGLLVGSLCNEEIQASLLAMALFFPNCFVSGVLWPLEGMPLVLQYISYALPCTLTSEAMRSLFARGWSFNHPNVWPGYLSMTVYIIIYFLLTVLIQRLKRV